MNNSGPLLEFVLEMYAYYQQGNSLWDTGERFHYTDSAVLYQFRKHGLPTRSPGRRIPEKIDAQTRRMYADYETGLSLREVGDKYGFSEYTVLNRFKKLNLPRRPAHRPSWKTV